MLWRSTRKESSSDGDKTDLGASRERPDEGNEGRDGRQEEYADRKGREGRGDGRRQRDEPRLRALAQLAATINEVLAVLTPAIGARELSYEDAIGWFVENRPGDLAASGAILRARLRDGRTEIIQVFLTAHHQVALDPRGVPYGRRFVVDRVDHELAESFGDTELIIVN